MKAEKQRAKAQEPALASIIVRLVENVGDVTAEGKRRTRVVIHEGVSFTLIDTHADDFDGLLRSILGRKDVAAKFSEKYIEKELRNLLVRLLREQSTGNAAIYLDELFAKLDAFAVEQVVYVPLTGLAPPQDSIPIGHITIRAMTDEATDTILRDIDAIIATTKHTDEEKAQFTEENRLDVAEHLRGRSCAEFRVVAESSRAHERAIAETHRALDLLRYAIPFLYRPDWHVAVGVAGELPTVPRWTMALSDERCDRDLRWVGSKRQFELTPEHIAVMRNCGVFAMADVLRKPDGGVTDFEQALLRALQWFAHAQTQLETGSQLLALVTSLESLLTPRDNNPIGTAIAEGTALLIGEDAKQRVGLKRRVQELYRLRSAVSHGGRKVILATDVNDLRQIDQALLSNVK